MLIVIGGAALMSNLSDDDGFVVAPGPSPVSSGTPEVTSEPSPPPTTTATATPSPTPTATPTPTPATIELRPFEVGRGETLFIYVQAQGAASASVLFRGESFPLVVEEDAFFAVLGVPLDAELATAELTVSARDGSGAELDVLSATYEVVAVERPVDFLTLTAEEASVLTPEGLALEGQLRAEQFFEFDRGRRWAGLFRLPTEGIFTTQFGSGRSTNGGPVGNFHTGTDIAAALGTPITASAVGRVAWVGAMPIRGNTVILDHGAGVRTGYHHLDETSVEVGQIVEAGAVLGLMGTTGLSTGSHLHWEMTIYGVNVDPMTWTRVDFTPSVALSPAR